MGLERPPVARAPDKVPAIARGRVAGAVAVADGIAEASVDWARVRAGRGSRLGAMPSAHRRHERASYARVVHIS